MKILVVSDTHGHNERLMRVIKREKDVSMLIHLGDLCGLEHTIGTLVDYPVHFVAGNCDGVLTPKKKIIEVDGKTYFLTHGNEERVGMSLSYMEFATKSHEAYVGLYGHTHVPKVYYGDGVVLANPGSLSLPRQEGGRPSYIIIDTNKGGEPEFFIKYL